MSDDRVTARLRVRVAESDVHYAGGVVDGAFVMRLFGDLATEIMIRVDGEEGLFRAYESVDFLAPVHAGDYLDAEAVLTSRGRTSRRITFTVTRSISALTATETKVEPKAQIVARAVGTVVSMRARQMLHSADTATEVEEVRVSR